MYDDLLVWAQVISRFVSNTAFIDDGSVFVRLETGLQEIPMYDPATVIALMNFNPHLMEACSQAWKYGEERIERAFTIAVFEQYMDEQALKSAEVLSDEVIEVAAIKVSSTLADIFAEFDRAIAKNEATVKRVQLELFSALDK